MSVWLCETKEVKLKPDFNEMTKEAALSYCYKYENEFKVKAYAAGDDGCKQFDCLITILEGDTISPSELPDYGMEFDIHPLN